MNQTIAAISFAILAALSTAVMDASAKGLVSSYPIFSLLALRSLIIVLIMAGYGFWYGGSRAFKITRLGYQAMRVLTILATSCFFFLALRTLPLTDVTVIFFGGTFFMILLSWPILGERIPIDKIMVVIVGFIGVVIVIRPEWGVTPIGGLFAALAAFCYALTLLIGRKVSNTESTFSLVFYGNLGVGLAAMPFITFESAPIPQIDLVIIILMAVSAMAAHLFVVRAMSLANAGTVAPFEYTGVVWAVIISMIFFGEAPAPHVLIGAVIVVAAGIYVVAKAKKDARALARLQSRP